MKKNSRPSSVSRRRFIAASGAVAGSLATATYVRPETADALSATAAAKTKIEPPIKIAEIFAPPEDHLWRLVKQCGVNHVVGTFSRKAPTTPGEKSWSYGPSNA
jgi:hypothetical protein